MDTGHNFQLPKLRKSVDMVLTALGITLFIAFATLGVRQANDKRIVTGNNQQQVPAVKDVELTAGSDETYIPYTISTVTDLQQPTQTPTSNGIKQNESAKYKGVEKASANKGRAMPEDRIRQN